MGARDQILSRLVNLPDLASHSSTVSPVTSQDLTLSSDFQSGGSYAGSGVMQGVAYGSVAWMTEPRSLPMSSVLIPEAKRQDELVRFQNAVDTVSGRLDQRARIAVGSAAELLHTTANTVRDSAWKERAERFILLGQSAVSATQHAIAEIIDLFLDRSGLLSERRADLESIQNRIGAELMGWPEPRVPHSEEPFILLADALSPVDAAGLQVGKIMALVTRDGGPMSHTAVIAKQLGIPCVVGVSDLAAVTEPAEVLVDGSQGTVTVDPDPQWAHALVRKDRKQRQRVRCWLGPGSTADGHRVRLLANVQDGPTARLAATGQAEGVGLFRTELCFINAQAEPSQEEQVCAYREVFDAFQGTIVVRTLDSGSDKPLAFADAQVEDNPALGVRGLRIGLQDEGLLTRQLDALATAARLSRGSHYQPKVMATMVSRISEAQRFASLARDRGIIPGVMVEVPAVAVMASEFLEHVDFFSIGTNDLTQYTMAADKLSPDLSELTDPWQPAVLHLISMALTAGARHGKTVSICGEAASDPLLARILVGLGATSLSMAAPAIAYVGQSLEEVSLTDCVTAARLVLETNGAHSARAAARAFFQ